MSIIYYNMIFKFLTKEGCGLCDRSLFLLRRLKRRHPHISFRVISIDDREEYRQYLNRVPVVLQNELVVCEMKFSERLVREWIEKSVT
jgi:hypothetical protein